MLIKSKEKIPKKYSKEHKEKLDIETKKILEHLEAKYKEDFDSLNSKFSQNEKEIEEQNLKISKYEGGNQSSYKSKRKIRGRK